MTALRYGKPMQSALRKAGGIFGLDLAGLFEEDNEALSDFAPGVEFEKTTKGKGGGLYMAPQPVTGETTRLQLLPRSAMVQSPSEITINIPAPPIQQLQEQVEEEEPILKKYFGAVGGVGVRDIGASGFGMKDYDAAIDAGYDPDSIKDWVRSNRYNLENIGPGAREVLDMEDYVNTNPGKFDYSKYGESGFGMKDVEALQKRGVSYADMERLALQAPRVGPKAAEMFGIKQPQKSTSSSSSSSGSSSSSSSSSGSGGFDYSAHGGSGFGMKDVEALKASGASKERMRDLAKNAPRIGPEARKLLGL
jgi:uncharacterized membrane protein YgcG